MRTTNEKLLSEWKRIRSDFKTMICQPVVAPLIRNRRAGIIIAAAIGIQLGLTAFGSWGWRCPFHMHLGIHCPGCGLSSAMILCLSGHLVAALKTHLFAPLLLLMLCTAGIHVCLPKRWHRLWVHRCRQFEKNTAVVPMVAIGMVIYWASRL